MAVPVADDQTPKSQIATQIARQQRLVAVHFDAIDAGKGRHHSLDARCDGRSIACRMDILQFGFGRDRIALILAAGAAIANEMLGRRDDLVRTKKAGRARRALQAFDHCACHRGDDFGVFRIALIGSAPTRIANDRQRWRKGPVDAGDGDLGRGRGADGANQRRIARRAEPDIVRKDCRADDVVVAVQRVDRPHRRDRAAAIGARRHCRVPIGVGEREPAFGGRALITPRSRIAAAQVTAEAVLRHVGDREAGGIGLDDLRDLLVERHARQDRLYPCFAVVGRGLGFCLRGHHGHRRRAQSCRRQHRRRQQPEARLNDAVGHHDPDF